MKIPIGGMTISEIRQELAQCMGADRYDFAVRLVDEIARLRDLEVVVCRTRWHDHEPQQDLVIAPEPATQLELIELTHMMGPGR